MSILALHISGHPMGRSGGRCPGKTRNSITPKFGTATGTIAFPTGREYERGARQVLAVAPGASDALNLYNAARGWTYYKSISDRPFLQCEVVARLRA